MTMKSLLSRALLPLVVIATVQCADDPTSPRAGSPDGLAPAYAVAQLAPISALEGTPKSFYCGTSSDAEGDALLCAWDFGNDGLVDAQCTTADAICRWDFDHDGVFEGQRSGSFSYVWPDQTTSEVRLDVSDASGQHSSTTAQVTVADVAPVLTGRTPLIFNVGQTDRIQTRFSDPGADGPWTFVFDFGDGNVNEGVTRGPDIGFGQFHAYADTGAYLVTVTVTDKDGVSSSYVRDLVVIDNQRPSAQAGGPYAGVEGSSVVFSSAGTTDDQSELTYAWDFGDGFRSILANPSRRYVDNGTYNVRLIVTDPAGAADTAWTSAVVTNAAPTGTPRIPAAREGSDYTLSLAGTDLGVTDRATLQYSFDCGQGAGPTAWSTSALVVCPALPDQASVTATYSVRDKDGGSTSYLRSIAVANVAPLVSLAATGATTVPVGGTVQIEARYTDPGAADGPFSYRLVWGDGVIVDGSTPGPMTDPPLVQSHTYTRSGTFTVYLFVGDKDGALRRSSSITVTVTP